MVVVAVGELFDEPVLPQAPSANAALERDRETQESAHRFTRY